MTPQQWEQNAQHFDFRGHHIFYRDDGTGDVIIAIHGFPTSSWDWCRIWPGLTARHRVLAPDLLGFGLSAKPRGHAYSLMEQADLVEALAAHRGITHAHLLAHDYGDSVAQELMARAADARLGFTLHSVCLLNGGIVPAAHRPVLMQRLLAGPFGALLGRAMNRRTLEKNFRRIFGPATPPSTDELDGYWYFIQHNHGPRVMHRLIRYMDERRANAARWTSVLRTPPAPLRLVFGARDPISGQHMIDAFRALNPAAPVTVLSDIGHYPQSEAPEIALREALMHCESASTRG